MLSLSERDHGRTIACGLLFGLSLGILGVSVPLLAISSGYTTGEIGFLVTLSALSQLVLRTVAGSLMTRHPDKLLLATSSGLISAACALLTVSSALPVFILSQLLQGAARAFFWPAAQTHAVRTSASTVTGMTMISLSAGSGQFVGPAIAGIISARNSITFTLLIGVLFGVSALVPSTLLRRLPIFSREISVSPVRRSLLWLRPGIDVGCWMSLVSGGWKGALDSYVPVALASAGQPTSTIGILISIANGMVLIGSGLASGMRRLGLRTTIIVGILATSGGIGAIGPTAGIETVVCAVLVISGAGAGLLQTVGPAISAEYASDNETGDAITVAGIFRASALTITPSGLAALTMFLPIGAAFGVAGLTFVLPVSLAARKWYG